MPKKMTWDEMKKTYPDEWLLVTDYKMDEYGNVIEGVVERHSKDKNKVYRLPIIDKDCAFEYTGESTFPGGWRAHVGHNHV